VSNFFTAHLSNIVIDWGVRPVVPENALAKVILLAEGDRLEIAAVFKAL